MAQLLAESERSPSLQYPDYWWYRARSEMLRTIIAPVIGTPERILDVGSADGPSVDWMGELGARTAVDLDPAALRPGDVQASALHLPFADGCFGAVTAFDVVEHCAPESRVVAELARVLRPGGRMFLTVPAYQWAWSEFDRGQGHHRRYTRGRLCAALVPHGLVVERATYLFAGTLPLFAAERISRRWRHLDTDEVTRPPEVSPLQERLLMRLCRLDARLLRRHDLPFGSSVLAIASRPAEAGQRPGSSSSR